MFSSVPLCPIVEIKNGKVDRDTCFSPTHCESGATLHYSCNIGFVGSNTTTTCLDNHVWDRTPTCVEEGKVDYLYI